MKQWQRWLVVAWLVVVPVAAHAAAGGAMPWDGFLENLAADFSGPVAIAAGTIAIALFGLAVAFAVTYGISWAVGIIFGLSIAMSAVTIVGMFGGK